MGARREDSREEEAEEEKNLALEGGENQQEVAPLGPEDRDYSCQHSLAATVCGQFLLSCSFMYLKSAACNKKGIQRGESQANGGEWRCFMSK